MRNETGLLSYKSDVYSQNGEDGIIARIFSVLGTSFGLCCEFGAWDGEHLSNTRRLIVDQSWRGIFIEADPERYRVLCRKYQANDRVTSICRCVDYETNTLGAILRDHREDGELDFLSVDIDGLDYEIFQGLDMRPKVICIEVNAGHSPTSTRVISRQVAARNVGQPLPYFCKIASDKGYRLVAYTGNAFFIRNDVDSDRVLPTLSAEEAYCEFLAHLSTRVKKWYVLANAGKVPPFYQFGNPLLSGDALEYSAIGRHLLRLSAARYVFSAVIKYAFLRDNKYLGANQTFSEWATAIFRRSSRDAA